MPLAVTRMSGLTFQWSTENHLPVRPHPAMTSSAIISTPWRSHISRIRGKYSAGGTSSLELTPSLVRVSSEGLLLTQNLSTGSFEVSGRDESWNVAGLSISHRSVEESPMGGMRTTSLTRFEVPLEQEIHPRVLTESQTTRVDDLKGGSHTSVSSRVEIRPDGTLRTHFVFPDGENSSSSVTF